MGYHLSLALLAILLQIVTIKPFFMNSINIQCQIQKLGTLVKDIVVIDSVYNLCSLGVILPEHIRETVFKALPDKGFQLDYSNIDSYNNDLERMGLIVDRYRKKSLVKYKTLLDDLAGITDISPDEKIELIQALEPLIKNAKII